MLFYTQCGSIVDLLWIFFVTSTGYLFSADEGNIRSNARFTSKLKPTHLNDLPYLLFQITATNLTILKIFHLKTEKCRRPV